MQSSERYDVLVLSPSYPERYYPEYWSYNLAGMAERVTLDLSVVVDTKPDSWSLDEVQRELEASVGGHG